MSLFSAFFTPHGKEPLYLKDLLLGYQKHVIQGSGMAGKYVGKTVGGGTGAFFGGLTGKGLPAVKEGYQKAGGYDPIADFNTRTKGITPDWMKEAPSWYKWAPPSSTEVIDTIKDVVKVPPITFPKIEIPSGIVQVGKLPDISMGADILGGIEMPSMPSFSLKDEEGDLNPLMIAALAIAGFYVVKKVV